MGAAWAFSLVNYKVVWMCTIGVFILMKSSCKHASVPLFVLIYIQSNRMTMELLSILFSAHRWKTGQISGVEP